MNSFLAELRVRTALHLRTRAVLREPLPWDWVVQHNSVFNKV